MANPNPTASAPGKILVANNGGNANLKDKLSSIFKNLVGDVIDLNPQVKSKVKSLFHKITNH